MTMNTRRIILLAAAFFADPLLAQTEPAPESIAPAAVVATPATTPAPISNASDQLPPPPTGKGQVVFFRKGGFVGSAISCAVREGDTKLSSLPPGRYFVQVAEPGIHSYAVKSESTDTLRMEIEAGETYYAQCSISMGIMVGRPNLSPSDRPAFFGMSAKLKPVEVKVN